MDLPQGELTTHLGRVRVNYTVSPRMFFSGLRGGTALRNRGFVVKVNRLFRF